MHFVKSEELRDPSTRLSVVAGAVAFTGAGSMAKAAAAASAPGSERRRALEAALADFETGVGVEYGSLEAVKGDKEGKKGKKAVKEADQWNAKRAAKEAAQEAAKGGAKGAAKEAARMAPSWAKKIKDNRGATPRRLLLGQHADPEVPEERSRLARGRGADKGGAAVDAGLACERSMRVSGGYLDSCNRRLAELLGHRKWEWRD